MYMLINTILFHCLIFPLIISWINYNINLANNTSLVGTFSTSCTTDNKSSNNLVTLEMQLQLHLPKKKKKNQLLICKISWTSQSILLDRCAPHSLVMGEGKHESNISSGRIKLRKGKGKGRSSILHTGAERTVRKRHANVYTCFFQTLAFSTEQQISFTAQYSYVFYDLLKTSDLSIFFGTCLEIRIFFPSLLDQSL